ncbi:Recovery protein 3 isoform 3, partial [Globisporangium splendens]
MAVEDAAADDALCVEVVNVDYYMGAPLPPHAIPALPSAPCYLMAREVPVVRIFGATPAGQKALLHIHGCTKRMLCVRRALLQQIFPYFYFRVENDSVFDNADELRRLLPQIAMELEKANDIKRQQQNANGPNKAKIVAKVLCGHAFLRLPPKPKAVCADLPVQPAVGVDRRADPRERMHRRTALPDLRIAYPVPATGRRRIDPYRPSPLCCLRGRAYEQVFADYNIEGMNYVHMSNVKFRAPVPTKQAHLGDAPDSGQYRVILRSNTPETRISGVQNRSQSVPGRHVSIPPIQKQWFDRHSSCALELDVAAEGILNPKIFQSLQASLRESDQLRNVPSLAAIWEEERIRRVRNGGKSTPEHSLSLRRNVDLEKSQSASVQSSSSLLSQSHFQEKMKESLASIVKEMERDMVISDNNHAHLEESSLMDFSGSSQVEVASARNSISTQSVFAFSQADTSGNNAGASQNQNTIIDEDEDIMNILLAMQTVDNPKWREKVSTIYSQAERLESSVETNFETDEERENDEPEGEDTGDEIGDILASQSMLANDVDDTSSDSEQTETPEKAEAASENSAPWWEVAQPESERSQNSFSEMGSPRVIFSTPRRRAHKVWRLLFPSSYILQIQEELKSQEDAVLLEDVEDLLPPPPPVRVYIASEKEDSFPVDRMRLSLTPRPQVFKRRTVRKESPPRATGRVWLYEPAPPSMQELKSTATDYGIDDIQYQPAFYSKREDIPDKAMIFGGKKFDFTPHDHAHMKPFDPGSLGETVSSLNQNATKWTKFADLIRGPQRFESGQKSRRKRPLQLEVSTTQSSHNPAALATISNVTVMSIEIYTSSRGTLLPDPLCDQVKAVCYAVEAQEGPYESKTKERGVILLMPEDDAASPHAARFCIESSDIVVRSAVSERELFERVICLVQEWDPDFLMGFEVQKSSIGYLVDRAAQLGINLIQAFSRLPSTNIDARNPLARSVQQGDDKENGDESIGAMWGITKASGLWVHGRYILNLWRMARSEVKLSRFAFEDVLRAVLKRELPVYSSRDLSKWYTEGGQLRWKVIRCVTTLSFHKHNGAGVAGMLNTPFYQWMHSEMARLFGIDFYSVLSRGSQYRVEAVMLRVTKRRNFLLVSPSRTQVAGQPPMECIPLVMEPHSGFYADPVVVLDFQSLYPSLVIGYNLCYSTYLGRLKDGMHPELESVLGVVDFSPSREGILECKDEITIVPNGTLFCPKSHRHGILPLILDEILSTRIMVKKSMKQAKEVNQERLEKVLNARFSGRMPCAQLADAIVQSGRCTLEAAVRMVEARADWNAKVVYGDTDSLFVLLKGRSKDDAFRIGQEIADAVTVTNPKPVTLKLEKVYLGCVLVSKKRYVGYKFERPCQETGVVESKGIEIVRRDSCSVVQNAMQSSLETLFTTSDLSRVKRLLEQYWLKMLDDRLPLKDFVFAKEVRLGTYSNGSAPPAALVATKAMARDRRAEPHYAERVPYVVVNGPPGARLMDLVVSPEDLVNSIVQCMWKFPVKMVRAALTNFLLMLLQIIPSLERLFLLIGANVRAWYGDLPRSSIKARQQMYNVHPARGVLGDTRSIDSFYMSKHCRLCGAIGMDTLCADCTANPQRSLFALHVMSAQQECALQSLQLACYECGDRSSATACWNMSCSVWNRIRLVQGDKVTL